MTDRLEQQLRDLFIEDATAAPGAASLADGALRRVRRRRRTRLNWAVGVTAATVAVGVVLGGSLPDGQQGSTPAASPSSPAAPSSGPAQGPVPGGDALSCAEMYSMEALARRAFAFDGTVAAIGPSRTARRDKGALSLVAATFTVNEWFHGGSGAQVTIDISAPRPQGTGSAEGSAPSYGVGTRLLASGEPRWGGAPLTDAVAWTGCGGFTRYYDRATADSWRAAFA